MGNKIFTSLLAALMSASMFAQTPIAVTCAAAAAAMPAESGSETENVYIVTGYVTNTNGAVSPSRTDPTIDQQTFYMDDVKGTLKTFQGYWCNLPGHEALNIGDKISVTGKITNYNNTPEIKNGDVAILERAVVVVDTINVSVCEALAEGSSLNIGDYSYDVFCVYGRLKGQDQVNNYGQHTFEIACTDSTAFKAYLCTGADNLELGKGDSVVVTGKLYNYNGIIEISIGKVELIEKAQHEDVVIEVNVAEATAVALALSNGATSDDRYAITGYVASIATAYNEQYNNISFFMTDDKDSPTYNFEAYRVNCTPEQAAKVLVGAKVKVTAQLQHYYRAATETTEEINLAETVIGGSLEIIEGNTCLLNISCDITKGSISAISGTYAIGTQLNITATPNYGCRFVQWSDGVTNNPRTIVLTQDSTISAEFSQYIYSNVKIGDLYYELNTDTKKATVLGLGVGKTNISVLDNSIADWRSMPANKVASCACPEDANYLGLKGVAVYADAMYINILVEYDPEEIPNHEIVPFHIFLNTDNSDLTGGYGDEFTDANTDIIMEGFFFMGEEGSRTGEPCAYEPEVFAWTGEVGGTGWFWEGLTRAAPLCWSQHVAGNYVEIQMLRELIPTLVGWNNNEFGIGFDIQQSWASVGILPLVSPTDENPTGHTSKLQVTIDQTHQYSYSMGPISSNLIIPSSVTYNGEKYAVTAINNSAFAMHTELTSVEIPTTMTSIAYNAFDGCDSITSVVWKAKNCDGYNFGSQVETFVFGDEVEVIPAYLCYRMNKLTTISIPQSVTSIGDYAFAYCGGLTAIEVPDNVTDVSYSAFYGCENVTSYKGRAEFFRGLYYTQKVVFTGGTIDFGSSSLNYNTRLTQVDVSACDNTTLPIYAFGGDYNLKQLVLPANLQSIGYTAVAECLQLEAISIPATVTEIDDRAFEDCRSLSEVTFEGTALTRIGDWAFYNCHELASINLPEGLTEIGKAAFYGCTYAEHLNVPSSVRSIGDDAFALCSKLGRIDVDAILPPAVKAKTFYEVSRIAPVYVPDESVSLYQNDAVWGELNIVGKSQAPHSIDNTSADQPKVTKLIHDGQIFILRGDKTYTLQGQEVE